MILNGKISTSSTSFQPRLQPLKYAIILSLKKKVEEVEVKYVYPYRSPQKNMIAAAIIGGYILRFYFNLTPAYLRARKMVEMKISTFYFFWQSRYKETPLFSGIAITLGVIL